MSKKRDTRRQTAWWAISALVVLAMLCSMVLMVRPAPPPAPTPTPTATQATSSAPAGDALTLGY